MKTYTIQVQSVDNGFVVQATSNDPPSNKRRVATSENELQSTLHDIVDHLFDASEKKPTEAK